MNELKIYAYDNNAPTAEYLKNIHEKMFRAVREANPTLPIIMMSRPKFCLAGEEEQRLHIIETTYLNAVSGGDNNLFMLPSDFHAWTPTAHHDNPQITERIQEFLNLDISTKAYHARRNSRLLYIWGHSYEFDRNNNWEHIEEICQKLSGNDEIWYATNIEIYDYVQAYKSLRYSADGHKVYNPTLLTIWLDVDGKLYSVNSGQTIRI